MAAPSMPFPQTGRACRYDMLAELTELRTGDLDWRGGRAFSLVYHADDPELEALLHDVGGMFLHENALNPFRYQTLLQMETEVVAMGCDLFGASCGAVTSGGTESIFLAVQTAREAARARGIERPHARAAPTPPTPRSRRPATTSASRWCSLPHGPDGRGAPSGTPRRSTARTVLVVASTPCYPFGVIDPVDRDRSDRAGRRACCATSTPASAAGCCRGGSGSASRCRRGTSRSTGSPRSRPTSTSTATRSRARRSCCTATAISPAPDLHVRRLARRALRVVHRRPAPARARRSPAPGPHRPTSAPRATCAWPAGCSTRPRGFQAGIARHRRPRDHERSRPVALRVRATTNADARRRRRGIDIDAVCDVMDDRGWNLDRQQGGLHLMVVARSRPGRRPVLCRPGRGGRPHGAVARGGEHVYGGVVT